MALIFSMAVAEAENKLRDHYWREAGLSFRYIKDLKVNNRVCARDESVTPDIFLGCIHGLNLGLATVEKRVNTVRVFAPEGFRKVNQDYKETAPEDKKVPQSELVTVLGREGQIRIEVVDFFLNTKTAITEQYQIYRDVNRVWRHKIDLHEEERELNLVGEAGAIYPVDIKSAVKFLETSVTPDNEISVASQVLRGKAIMKFHDHSSYIPGAYLDAVAQASGESKLGIGMDYHFEKGKGVIVDSIVQGSVVDRKTDIRIGDRLVSVNGITLGPDEQIRPSEFKDLFVNQKIVPERLVISREGNERRYEIKPEEYENPYLYHWFINEGNHKVSYLKLRTFSYDNACSLIEEKLDDDIGKGSEALILDLRYNHGGQVDTAACIADLLLGNGKTIAYSIPLDPKKKRHREVISAGSRKAKFNLPVTILVNADSASSSELLAGGLAAHGRALLVGDRTSGKGTMQDGEPYLDTLDGVYEIKTYRTFYFFNDSTAHLHGITPHLSVKTQFSEIEAENRVEVLSVNPVELSAGPLKLYLPHRFNNCIQEDPVSGSVSSKEMIRYFADDQQMEKALDLSYCQVNDDRMTYQTSNLIQ